MELLGRRFGHIRITDVAGQGGMGDVYVGYDEKLDRKVALKALHAEHRLDAEARERLLREARTLSKVDHQHICRIHDYMESSDVDLLVLEYIDGQTLQDAVEQGRLSRAEKLRIALAIADDANNVWFPVDDSSATVLPRTRKEAAGKHFHRTEAGVTMGTPLYMSPEQARGEELTVASDMYSYGLVLQFLFTAADPHPSGLTAREVILRAARGEKVAADNVPGDIASLITRLTQYAPADRPTAIEATARLKFLIDRPRRLVRRAAIALAVLLVVLASWRYTSDLARERTAAVTARAEAESRRAQAENLIEFMLGDLRKKLDTVGRLDILDDVGVRALAYVDSLDPSKLSASDLARNAKALNHLGEVRQTQGNNAATALFERSLKLAGEALRREPRNPEALLTHGAAHFWLGNGLRLQGRNDDALPHMRAYMKDGDLLSEVNPENEKYQLERAYGHTAVAQILEAKGALREALDRYETSLRIKSRIAEESPADNDAQAELTRAINKVGAVEYKLGEFRDARANFEREVAIHRALLARDPKQTQWKSRLATAMAYLANVRYHPGETAGAATLWNEELTIERELAVRDPTNVDWQRNVAVTLRRIAVANATSGNRESALAKFAEARQRISRVADIIPKREYLAIDRWAIDVDYGRALLSFGAGGRAIPLFAHVLDETATGTPNDRLHVLRARAALNLADAQAKTDPRAAEQNWRLAENEFAAVTTAITEPYLLDSLFRVLLHRGRIAEAKQILNRIRSTGYSSAELEKLCNESGC